LKNSSFSFAFPSDWIPELRRFYYVTIAYNQLQGYIPEEVPPTISLYSNIKWCSDEFAPDNWTYSTPQYCRGVSCYDCTYLKLISASPEKFYPYEDSQIKLTFISIQNVQSPLQGFTIDFNNDTAIRETSNQTKYYLFNNSSVSSNWSIASGIAQYSKPSLENLITSFSSSSPVTPFQKVQIYPYFNFSTEFWNLYFPVFNSCYPGNSYNKASQSCYPCSPGYFHKVVDGVPICLPCPVGTYQKDGGKTFCMGCYGNATTIGTGSIDASNCLCPSGFHGDGWSFCSSCPEFSSSNPGTKSHHGCFCKSSFYGKAYLNQSCFSCQFTSGNERIAECPSDNLTFPVVDNGWFMRNSITNDGSLDLLKCTPAASCTAGICSVGYTGDLCGDCIRLQYFRQDLVCKKCKDNTWSTWVLMVLAILVINLMILMNSYPSPTKKVSVSITITWVQIIALFAEIPVSWPTSVYGMFQTFGFANFNLDIFAPECSVPLDYWTKWTFKLCLPLIVLAGLGVIFLIQELGANCFPHFQSLFTRRVLRTFGMENNTSELKQFDFGEDPYRYSRYVYGPVVIISILYSFLSSLSFQPLMCVYQSDGSYTMALNSVEKCFSSTWMSRLPQTIFFILLYPIGIPVTLGIIFFKNLDKADTEKFRRYFGGITLSYRSHLFWWEAVDLIRRVSIIMLLKLFFLFQMKFLQLFLAVAILFIYMIFYVFLQPFKRPEMNFLSSCWMIASIICLFTGVVFKVSELQDFERTAFTVVVIFVIIFCLIVSVWVFSLELMSHYRISLLQRSKRQDYFAISETRKKMLQERFSQMHESLWTQVSYMSLENQDKFFSDLKQLERIERPLQAASMLDTDDVADNAPRGIGIPGRRFRGSVMVARSSVESKETNAFSIAPQVGTVEVQTF
jgi:hypothetical protein